MTFNYLIFKSKKHNINIFLYVLTSFLLFSSFSLEAFSFSNHSGINSHLNPSYFTNFPFFISESLGDKKQEETIQEAETTEEVSIDTTYFIEVDTPPEFINGGEAGMENEIMTKLSPHLDKYESGLYQYIFEYVVNVDGTLSQVKIVKKNSLSEELDVLIFDIISNLKGWKPGIKDDKIVRTKLSRSFIFAIDR